MFDRTFAFLVLSIVFIPCLFISIVIKLNSKGPVIHWSRRIGQNDSYFFMPKFRTMRTSTPQLASHLMTDPSHHITSIGYFLRKYSIDEIPQFWSVLIGDMKVVGPRPALYNQEDLIQLRIEKGINLFKPGITGWAQINGRDFNTIKEKIELETYYIKNKSTFLDFYIILKTFIKIFNFSETSH